MNGEALPRDDHILRYCSPGKIPNGTPTPDAFEFPLDGLSVFWLEGARGVDKADCLARCASHAARELRIKQDGAFASLNIGRVLDETQTQFGVEVMVVHRPRNGLVESFDDSHSQVEGYPLDPDTRFQLAHLFSAVLVSEMLSVP